MCSQIKASMEGKRSRLISENAGEREQMDVEIREVDPFNLWVRASTSGSAHQGSNGRPCIIARQSSSQDGFHRRKQCTDCKLDMHLIHP